MPHPGDKIHFPLKTDEALRLAFTSQGDEGHAESEESEELR
jgi:hypothetical protein